jgi:hypothetical protein
MPKARGTTVLLLTNTNKLRPIKHANIDKVSSVARNGENSGSKAAMETRQSNNNATFAPST